MRSRMSRFFSVACADFNSSTLSALRFFIKLATASFRRSTSSLNKVAREIIFRREERNLLLVFTFLICFFLTLATGSSSKTPTILNDLSSNKVANTKRSLSRW